VKQEENSEENQKQCCTPGKAHKVDQEMSLVTTNMAILIHSLRISGLYVLEHIHVDRLFIEIELTAKRITTEREK